MINVKQVAIGSDHAGFSHKQKLIKLLNDLKIPFVDCGTFSEERCDYPDFAHLVSQKVSTNECDYGILVCGTGLGMSMTANKHKGVRAAVCESLKTAELTRAHNNANILCFGERVVSWELAEQIVKTFFNTKFEGERHIQRINKIHSLTNL